MTLRSRRVYKIGGPALDDPQLLNGLALEIKTFDGDLALVHGGGRQVERMLTQLGIESKFIDGRRATSRAAMEIVEMVLSGSMNKALTSGLCRAGVPAVGLSGRDGSLIRAALLPGLGCVGAPDQVNLSVLDALWTAGFVPVLSPVSSDTDGAAVNVNADEAAQWVARSIGAETLVFLSDVDGVVLDGEPVPELHEKNLRARLNDGSIHGGMALKVQMALDAVRSGIPSVVIAGRARLSSGFPGTRICLS